MSIINQIKDDDQFWSKLIYDACRGDAVQMRELKQMDVFDFFDYIDRDGGSRTHSKGRQQPVRQ